MSDRTFVSRLLPLVSGVTLYVFAAAWKAFAVLAIPLIFALHEGSPRLAMLGWLALTTSPALFAGLTHRVAHGVIDGFDVGSGKTAQRCSRGMASAWAGLFAWLAMSFAAMTSVLLMLVLYPLPQENRLAGVLALAEDLPLRLGVHAAIWVAVASAVFWVERGARGHEAA